MPSSTAFILAFYKHTNKINGKVYIGITKRNIYTRWGKNGIHYMNQILGRAIKKYGWDNFTHEILFTNLSCVDAKIKEIELIKEYDATNPKHGYNITAGGDGCCNYKHSEKAKQVMKVIAANRNYKGKNNPNYGNGNKISGSHNPSYGISPKKRMDAVTYKRWHNALSENSRGKNNPMYGTHRCNEQSANKKATICLNDNLIFATAKQAAEYYGIKIASFRMYMAGKAKLPKAFRHLEFKYIEEAE